jgi:DNA-binding CsgD family transcriptional regulator
MSSAPSAIPSDTLAMVVSGADGAVVAQNRAARRLMGEGVGRTCWKVVGGIRGAEGLPCARGCVRELLRGGLEAPRRTPIRLQGRRLLLTCIPVRGVVLSMLSEPARAEAAPWQALTTRELQVLRMLAEGATSSAIASRLALSHATVRTHVEHIRTKLGAKTRAGLVALGFRLGFLD